MLNMNVNDVQILVISMLQLKTNRRGQSLLVDMRLAAILNTLIYVVDQSNCFIVKVGETHLMNSKA